MDFGIVTGATCWKDVRNTVDGACGHERLWIDEGYLADVVEIKVGSEMGKGFEFFDAKVGAEVVAESASEVGELGDG